MSSAHPLLFLMMKNIFIITLLLTKVVCHASNKVIIPAITKPNVITITLKEFSIADTSLKLLITDTTHQLTVNKIIIIPDKPLKKRLVTGFLAFPFPLGFLGTHRIMLGTKPWVPVVYIATFGGCFGLLPLVDFCVLLFSDDIEQYENNPNIFMWIK